MQSQHTTRERSPLPHIKRSVVQCITLISLLIPHAQQYTSRQQEEAVNTQQGHRNQGQAGEKVLTYKERKRKGQKIRIFKAVCDITVNSGLLSKISQSLVRMTNCCSECFKWHEKRQTQIRPSLPNCSAISYDLCKEKPETKSV